MELPRSLAPTVRPAGGGDRPVCTRAPGGRTSPYRRARSAAPPSEPARRWWSRSTSSAVIQPGGSMRDDLVIAAADERGLAMVFTGMRHFRH